MGEFNSLTKIQDVACSFIRALKAFTAGQNPVQYYENIADPYSVAKTIFYYLSSLVSFVQFMIIFMLI